VLAPSSKSNFRFTSARQVWCIVSTLGLASIVAMMLVVRVNSREPTFEGRPISGWLSKLQDPNESDAARRAIRVIGRGAIPYLIERLTLRETPSRRFLDGIKSLPGNGTRPVPSTTAAHDQAVYGFRVLGTKAAEALPQLAQLLAGCTNSINKDLAVPIAQAMGEIGEESIPLLTEALQNPCREIRVACLTALSMDLGDRAEKALPSILPKVNDADAEVRGLAVYFVARFCTDNAVKTRTLSLALMDSDKSVRAIASHELAASKANGEHAAP